MKKRDYQSGGVSFWDLLIIVLIGVLAYFLYIRGHLDKYLPEEYASATAAAAREAANAPSEPTNAEVQPINLGTLERRYWPRQIQLRRSLEFPVMTGGQQTGSMTAPAGAIFDVAEIRAKEVVIKNGGSLETVAAGDTDVLERAYTLKRIGAPELKSEAH